MTDTKELSNKTCFVVTPIGNADEPIRRHIDGIINAVIKPALGEKYEIEVAHEMTKIGSINKQVIEAIYKSDLVIANLTNKNPNVMYELAFRHCLGKPVIQIAEKGTILPFDIGTERTIPYTDDAQGVLDLIEEIKEYEKMIDFNNDKQGPIYDILKSINNDDTIIKMFNVNQGEDNGDTKQLLIYMINKFDELNNRISNKNSILDNIKIESNRESDNNLEINLNGFFELSDKQKYKICTIIGNKLQDMYCVSPGISFDDYGNVHVDLKGFNVDSGRIYNELDKILKEYSLSINKIIENRNRIIG